ncbi:MAG: hypothetical protein PHI42_08050 [Paludibacteraceae bacterium]|nr:hypothetical protein [Paludibacteraceae bacterium]MDD3480320.1 hypothetical protein [Paludibacteraceae bacterium]
MVKRLKVKGKLRGVENRLVRTDNWVKGYGLKVKGELRGVGNSFNV